MSEMNDPEQSQSMFAAMIPLLGEAAPPSNVAALGHMMREWLRAVVADAGTDVDSGAGFGAYDLHVKMGGEIIHVQIKREPPLPASDPRATEIPDCGTRP